MNYRFKLSNIQVSAPEIMLDLKIGEIAVEVDDLSLMESLKVAKEMPGIILDLRRAIELPLSPLPHVHVCGHQGTGMSMHPLAAMFAEVHKEMRERQNDSATGNDEISEDEEIESVVDSDDQERCMFDALLTVTNINASEFQGGLHPNKGDGLWSTKAYSFCVTTIDNPEVNRKRWMEIGKVPGYVVYIEIVDKDCRKFGEKLAADYQARLEQNA